MSKTIKKYGKVRHKMSEPYVRNKNYQNYERYEEENEFLVQKSKDKQNG